MRLRLLGILTPLLLLNTGYIAAFNTPSLFYMANVVLHLALGLMLTFGAFRTVRRLPTVPLAASALIGLAIVATGNTRDFRWLLILHIAAGVAAVGALLYWSIRSSERAFQRAVLAGSMAALALPIGAAVARRLAPDPRDRITNPLLVPTSMQE